MKYKIYISICAVMIISASVAYAMKVYEISFDNHIKTGSVDIRIEQFELCDGEEKLIESGTVMPNQNVSYIPRVTNLRGDGYVRVKVELVMDKKVPRPLKLEDVYQINEDWIQKGEYFYNTKVMKEGDSSALFRGFHVPDKWTQETASGFRFTVTADVIQNNNFSPDFNSISPWGSIVIEKAKDEENICYGIAHKKGTSPVFEYISGEGLISEYSDLFSNFSCFMAGDTYEDTLIMKNRSNNDIKVFFRTNTVNDNMLKKMKLKIICDNREVYDGNLVSDALKDFKELTVIKGIKDGVFHFEVLLPEDAGNYYSELKDNVVWEFRVEEIGGSNVKTSDEKYYGGTVFLMLFSFGVFVAALLLRRKEKNEKNY